eukprot:6173107-Pleurochrysis_carterae.AAC.1
MRPRHLQQQDGGGGSARRSLLPALVLDNGQRKCGGGDGAGEAEHERLGRVGDVDAAVEGFRDELPDCLRRAQQQRAREQSGRDKELERAEREEFAKLGQALAVDLKPLACDPWCARARWPRSAQI